MKKHARRLTLMGLIPANPKYVKKRYIPLSVEDRLIREGWVRSGGGFSDPLGRKIVYNGYMRESFVDVPRLVAIPKYTLTSFDPEYWMYGRLMKRDYIFHYLDDDRIEERGASYHKTADTLTFKNTELAWCCDDGL